MSRQICVFCCLVVLVACGGSVQPAGVGPSEAPTTGGPPNTPVDVPGPIADIHDATCVEANGTFTFDLPCCAGLQKTGVVGLILCLPAKAPPPVDDPPSDDPPPNNPPLGESTPPDETKPPVVNPPLVDPAEDPPVDPPADSEGDDGFVFIDMMKYFFYPMILLLENTCLPASSINTADLAFSFDTSEGKSIFTSQQCPKGQYVIGMELLASDGNDTAVIESVPHILCGDINGMGPGVDIGLPPLPPNSKVHYVSISCPKGQLLVGWQQVHDLFSCQMNDVLALCQSPSNFSQSALSGAGIKTCPNGFAVDQIEVVKVDGTLDLQGHCVEVQDSGKAPLPIKLAPSKVLQLPPFGSVEGVPLISEGYVKGEKHLTCPKNSVMQGIKVRKELYNYYSDISFYDYSFANVIGLHCIPLNANGTWGTPFFHAWTGAGPLGGTGTGKGLSEDELKCAANEAAVGWRLQRGTVSWEYDYDYYDYKNKSWESDDNCPDQPCEVPVWGISALELRCFPLTQWPITGSVNYASSAYTKQGASDPFQIGIATTLSDLTSVTSHCNASYAMSGIWVAASQGQLDGKLIDAIAGDCRWIFQP